MHENWNRKINRFKDDIGLIRLNASVTFNKYVQPICLLTSDQEFFNGSIAGWGVKIDERELSDVPITVDLTFSKLEQCVKDNSGLSSVAWNDSFCFKKQNNMDIGSCRGDGGSGIFVKVEDRFYLKGFKSWRLTDHCSENSQILSIDIFKYFNFIRVRYQMK